MAVAVPYAKNPAPAQLTMPDFSKSPGGFGAGQSASNVNFTLLVVEEYADGSVRLLCPLFPPLPAVLICSVSGIRREEVRRVWRPCHLQRHLCLIARPGSMVEKTIQNESRDVLLMRTFFRTLTRTFSALLEVCCCSLVCCCSRTKTRTLDCCCYG